MNRRIKTRAKGGDPLVRDRSAAAAVLDRCRAAVREMFRGMLVVVDRGVALEVLADREVVVAHPQGVVLALVLRALGATVRKMVTRHQEVLVTHLFLLNPYHREHRRAISKAAAIHRPEVVPILLPRAYPSAHCST